MHHHNLDPKSESSLKKWINSSILQVMEEGRKPIEIYDALETKE